MFTGRKYNTELIAKVATKFDVTDRYVRKALNNESHSQTAIEIKQLYNERAKALKAQQDQILNLEN